MCAFMTRAYVSNIFHFPRSTIIHLALDNAVANHERAFLENLRVPAIAADVFHKDSKIRNRARSVDGSRQAGGES